MTPHTSHNAHHRAVVVTALPVEYNAVRAHLTDIAEDEHPEGDVYERGLFHAVECLWEVGIVQMGVGNPNAALKTERAIAYFEPDAVLFVGVAGGIKDVTIGDVVVATKVYGYHSGKADDEFKTRPEVGLPQYRILERANAEARKTDWLKRLTSVPDPAPRVFLGAIAAGEQVVTSTQSASYKLIRNAYNDALAVEMESYGFLKAAQAHSNLEALAVRGISDLLEGKAEADKGGSQEYTSRHAAAFAFEVLAKLTLPDRTVRTEIREVIREIPAPHPVPARSTLPSQPYFFGRVEELKTIAAALAPESRTWGALIDGPGGIGKTALAIRAAHDALPDLFERKIFITAKVRELTPEGEKKLTDFTRSTYLAMLDELGKELGEEISRLAPDERTNALRLALAGKKALIIFDNLETLPEDERTRLFQFISRLPEGNKAIVTSRRRSDVDARIVRLDRLARDEALQLIAELAAKYPRLARASGQERDDLYAITQGNPLFIRWIAGQLGRAGSQCHTIAEACKFVKQAPKGNDPLEYIFGDLLETFTKDETLVLAALTYFTQPARLAWLAQMTELTERAAETALEDLTDRSILIANLESRTFYLPPLAATFIRTRRPEAVTQTGDALVNRAYALAMQYGGGSKNYEKFPLLDAEWEFISAALPRLLMGDNDRLQSFYSRIDFFLDFTGRWDDILWLTKAAEECALAAGNREQAGRRAFEAGWVYNLRNQPAEVLACADRADEHLQDSNLGNKAIAIRLRGFGHKLKEDYPAAIAAFREALGIYRSISPESDDVSIVLNSLAEAERASKDYSAAENDYREALRIAKKIKVDEGIAIYTCNLAELALDREQWAEAETLAREALAICEKIGNVGNIAYASWDLAKALLKQNKNLKEALTLSRRAVEIFTRLGAPDILQEAQETLAEIEQALSGK